MEDKDWYENCFSHLDMDGDDSFDILSQCQTNSSVKSDEFRGDILRQLAFSSGTETEIHSLYPSSGIQGNSAVSGLSFEEIGLKGQSLDSWNAVAGMSPEQDYSCLKRSGCGPRLSSKRTLEKQSFEAMRANQGTKKARSSSVAQDHIMAERRRRQEMAETFIALSAIIPGLKKKDKASVLREAVNYVKQLQERIATLEKGMGEKNSTNSMILINKSHLCAQSCEANSNDDCGSNEVLPLIEAVGLEKEVLIRIHCEKQNGIMLKLLALLENIHLPIASSSMFPFGSSTLNITIIAQKDEEYNMSVNDLVKNLRQDLLKLYDIEV